MKKLSCISVLHSVVHKLIFENNFEYLSCFSVVNVTPRLKNHSNICGIAGASIHQHDGCHYHGVCWRSG